LSLRPTAKCTWKLETPGSVPSSFRVGVRGLIF